jgi:triosephosphate isomerase
VASQDAYDGGAGAFTGAVPAELAADAGATWTLVGHSERRALFGDADAVVTAKVTKALAVGLSVIACVGETLAQREGGDAVAVVSAQLAAIAAGVPRPADWGRLVVAYEPVWAIGTGKVATPDVAQEMHAAIRAWVAAPVSADVADALRLQYGGSVSPANAADLAACPDVDGFLVGGASLKADACGEIVRAGAGGA